MQSWWCRTWSRPWAPGLVETGRMGRDLGALTAEVFGAGTGLWDLDWEPWSAVGKAYAAGQSTTDIAWSVVDGISSAVDGALYAAEHGDYAPLMNLSGEIAVELLLARGLLRAGALRAGRERPEKPLARRRPDRVGQGRQVAGRYQRVLGRARAVRARLARAKNLPRRLKDELDALTGGPGPLDAPAAGGGGSGRARGSGTRAGQAAPRVRGRTPGEGQGARHRGAGEPGIARQAGSGQCAGDGRQTSSESRPTPGRRARSSRC